MSLIKTPFLVSYILRRVLEAKSSKKNKKILFAKKSVNACCKMRGFLLFLKIFYIFIIEAEI